MKPGKTPIPTSAFIELVLGAAGAVLVVAVGHGLRRRGQRQKAA